MNNHRFARYATAALALTAVGATTASARPDPPVVPAAADTRPLDARIAEWRAETARVLAEDRATEDAPTALPTPAAGSDDVDWGAADIGAGAVGVVLLGLGAVGLARRRTALRAA
jgi:hypothetical protein